MSQGREMVDRVFDAPQSQAGRAEIRRLLGKAIRALRRKQGRPMLEEDEVRIQAAMESIEVICVLFREAFFEQAHSVRVSQIVSEFDDLADLIKAADAGQAPEVTRDRARTRIKAWSHEARRWVGDLPLHQVVTRLPERDGLTSLQRRDDLRQCWFEADGARFSPPSRRAGALKPDIPAHFQVAELRLPAGWQVDPMDVLDPATGLPKWDWNPQALLRLMALAKETLLIEAEGGDRGGATSFARRRYRGSLRDALAFSGLQVFEEAVGPKSARQTQSGRPGARRTDFEAFVCKLYRLALGAEAPAGLKLGPDPIRRAIATQRAWQRLFKLAEVRDGLAFYDLPGEVQDAALARLSARTLACLHAPAQHWG